MLPRQMLDVSDCIRVRFHLGVQEGKHDLACLLIPGTPSFPVPSIEWIACRQRCMESCPDHGERCEVAVVHPVYGDQSAIGVAKGFNCTKIERLIALRALGTA